MLSVLAHNVGADSLPAPSWLLGYLGALAILGAAAWLRGSWTTARLGVAPADEPDAWDDALPAASRWGLVGQLVGLALLALTFAVAVAGPDEPATNVARLAVFRVWPYALPLLCLALGDVLRVLNPIRPIVAAIERTTGHRGSADGAPPWTAAVFLAAFWWVYLAYHSPGSPGVVAVVLAAYSLAAVAGGVAWGQGWLASGEGFGAVSAAVGRLTHRRTAAPVPGVLALAVVWLGAAVFDGVSTTSWWVDVLGTRTGWSRTLLNTVGLVWMTAIVAAVALAALRVAEARAADGDDGASAPSLVRLLGVAAIPIAAAWYLADNLPLLLAEGQDFIALVSDPFGKGWDLFGTIDLSIDYTLATADWVQWVQLAALVAGHLAMLVVVHDGAIARLGRRRGMRVTWTMAGVAAASFVGASMLVL
jgi:hypothetical protein